MNEKKEYYIDDRDVDTIYKEWLLANPDHEEWNTITPKAIEHKLLEEKNNQTYINNIYMNDYIIIDEKYEGILWGELMKYCYFLKIKNLIHDEESETLYQFVKIKYKDMPIKIIQFIDEELPVLYIQYTYKSNLYTLIYDYNNEELTKNVKLLTRNSEFTISYSNYNEILEIIKPNIDVNIILNNELALNIDTNNNINIIKKYANYFLAKNNLNFLIELENFDYKKNIHICNFKTIINNWLTINTYQKPIHELNNYEIGSIELDNLFIYKIVFDKVYIYDKNIICIIFNDMYVTKHNFIYNELKDISCFSLIEDILNSILASNKDNIVNLLLKYIDSTNNNYIVINNFEEDTAYYTENIWFLHFFQTNYRKNKRYDVDNLRLVIKNQDSYSGLLLKDNFISFHKNLDEHLIKEYYHYLYIYKYKHNIVRSIEIDTDIDFSHILNADYLIEDLGCRLYMEDWEYCTDTTVDLIIVFDDIALIFIWENLYIMKLEVSLFDYDFDEYNYIEEEILEIFFPLILMDVIKKGTLSKMVEEDESLKWVIGVNDSIFETKSALNREYIMSYGRTMDDIFFERSGLLFTET